MTPEQIKKAKPMLASQLMVKNVLAGIQTQDRRPINPQPRITEKGEFRWTKSQKTFRHGPNVEYMKKALLDNAPYQVGDIIYLRETWKIASFLDGEPLQIQGKDGKSWEEWGCDEFGYEEWYEKMIYQSSDDCEKSSLEMDENGSWYWDKGNSPCRWRPSIHMPKWAARLFLEVQRVWVEQNDEGVWVWAIEFKLLEVLTNAN